ncbi:MAG: hypothetical protein ACK54C_00175 [Betaproteobacteria bacterium]
MNQSNQHLNRATMVRGACRFRASLTACVIAGGIVVLVALKANSRTRPVEAPSVDSAMPAAEPQPSAACMAAGQISMARAHSPDWASVGQIWDRREASSAAGSSAGDSVAGSVGFDRDQATAMRWSM